MKVIEMPKPWESHTICKDCGAHLFIEQDDLVYGHIGKPVNMLCSRNVCFYFTCMLCGYDQQVNFLQEYVQRSVKKKYEADRKE